MVKETPWTTEERYRPYHEWPANCLEELRQQSTASSWRFGYHIQPETGLLNDPNGFAFFNGKWQLFYQAFPMGPVHGIKSWYHLTSDNLVDWQSEGLKLLPDTPYDSHGVYSGSALPVADRLFLAYTGNVRDQEWQRHSYQLGAWMDPDGKVTKIPQPLIPSPPAGYTQDIRDPQVFPYQDGYLLVIGAQDQQKQGQILTYFSRDLEEWQLLGPLSYTREPMGYMVECPNLLFLQQQAVLLFCPQGLDHKQHDYKNIYPNTYLLAEDYDFVSNSLTEVSEDLRNLDEGFDLYATQGFTAPDGRTLTVGWIGLPEIEYPSDAEGWAHCLSIVKELQIADGELLQKPVPELTLLRISEAHKLVPQELMNSGNNRYELQLAFPEAAQGTLTLFSDEQQSQGLIIHYDTVNGQMKLDRSSAGRPFAEAYGETREFAIAKGPLSLQIFVDSSVAEVFINEGRQTATTRVFPEAGQTYLHLEGTSPTNSQLWQLRDMKGQV